MSNMLVSVPRLCTTVPFVYISFSHIAQGANTSPTWLRSLFFICSFFTLHTHSKACLLFCVAQLAWERANNNNNKKKKKPLKKSSISPFSPLIFNLQEAQLFHTSFQLSTSTPPQPCAHPTRLCWHWVDWQAPLLMVGIWLSLCQRYPVLTLPMMSNHKITDTKRLRWQVVSLMLSRGEKECHIFWFLLSWR